MATTTGTGRKERVSFTPEVMEAFALHPGARVRISIEPQELFPLHPDARRLIDEMMGMFAGGPSLSKELKKERREQDLRSKW